MTPVSDKHRHWGSAVVALSVVLLAGGAAGYGVRLWRPQLALERARATALKEPSRAVAAYELYFQLAPADYAARLELARILKRRDAEAALAQLRTIPTTAPEFVMAARLSAGWSLELGRDYDARGPLEFLVERLPEDSGVLLELGELHFRAREFDKALEYAKRCRTVEPNKIEACLLMADSLDELQRSAEMIEPLETALRVDPEIPQAHLNLAFAYHLIGRNDDAFEHVRWFLDRFPQTANAHRVLAQVERGRGRYEQALVAIREALRLQPFNLEAALIEADLLLFLRRATEAHERLTELAPRFAGDRRLLAVLARTAVATGRRTEAAEYLSKLQRLRSAD